MSSDSRLLASNKNLGTDQKERNRLQDMHRNTNLWNKRLCMRSKEIQRRVDLPINALQAGQLCILLCGNHPTLQSNICIAASGIWHPHSRVLAWLQSIDQHDSLLLRRSSTASVVLQRMDSRRDPTHPQFTIDTM